MQINVNCAELADTVSALRNFVKIPLPARYAYRFQSVARVLDGKWNNIRESHDQLVRKYGKPSEDGKSIVVTSENVEVYSKERDDLLSGTMEIDFEPIPLSALGNAQVSIQEMSWLRVFFYDDDPASQ